MVTGACKVEFTAYFVRKCVKFDCKVINYHYSSVSKTHIDND